MSKSIEIAWTDGDLDYCAVAIYCSACKKQTTLSTMGYKVCIDKCDNCGKVYRVYPVRVEEVGNADADSR